MTRIHTRSSNSTVTLKGKHGTAVMRNSLQCSYHVGGREGHVMALLRLNTQKVPTDIHRPHKQHSTLLNKKNKVIPIEKQPCTREVRIERQLMEATWPHDSLHLIQPSPCRAAPQDSPGTAGLILRAWFLV